MNAAAAWACPAGPAAASASPAEWAPADPGVGLVRAGHPLLHGEMTPERFAAVVAAAPSFSSSLLTLMTTDLVGRAGRRLYASMIERLGLVAFDFPVDVPPVSLAMAWHRRYEADTAHAWLRDCTREVLTALMAG